MIELDQSALVAPADRSIAARKDGRMPRTMARLRTDGGTSFVLKTDQRKWDAGFRKTFEYLQQQAREERPRGAGNPTVRIPLPRVPHGAGLAFDGAADADGVDPRLVGWSDEASRNPHEPGVLAEAFVQGLRGEYIRLYVHDRADIHIFRRRDAEGVVHWECRVTAKARELYADGLNLWMVRWLGLLSWVLQGKWCTPREAHAAGWNVSQWHLNSDFADLDLEGTDTRNFCGFKKGSRHSKSVEPPEHVKLEEFDQDDYFTQTIYLGRKTSDTCVAIYRKGDQLREAKRIDPGASMYAPLWRANGWQGEELTRVELRLRKKGLQYVRPGTSEVVYDFRDPALLLNPEAVLRLWAYVTTRRRLVCRDSREQRRTRSPLDPAWQRVMRVGLKVQRGPEFRQIPHQVRAMTRRERMAKSQRRAMNAAIDFAAQHGAELHDAIDIGRVLVAMGERFMDHGMPAEFDALPNPPNVKDAGRYAAMAASFFAAEADAHYQDFCEEVGARLCPTRFMPHGPPPGAGDSPPEHET